MTVDVTNTGARDGVEIVQLYVNDVVSSVTTPCKALKAYARVALAAGETKAVTLAVPVAALTIVRPDLAEVVEPGDFEAMVGPSSADADLVKLPFTVR